MGYNGSNGKRSNRGYKGFPKSSTNFANNLFFGRKGIITTVIKSTSDNPTKSTRGHKSVHYYTNYDLGSTITNDSFFEKTHSAPIDRDSSNEEFLFALCLFTAITLILFILAFAEVWWFGFCYFLGCLSFWSTLLSIILYRSFSTNKDPSSLTLVICGLSLCVFGILPFNIYSDSAIIDLNVNSHIPYLIELESIIGILGGLSSVVFGIYLYFKKCNR